MNYVISITHPQLENLLLDIFRELNLTPSMAFMGHGTASKHMLDLLGIDSPEKRIFFTVADQEKTKALISAQRRRMYIDVPGNGIVIAVPIKSVGGASTLEYLSGGEPKKVTDIDYVGELIVAVANEGHTDTVMTAARLGGASGGTVLHGKGTGIKGDRKFYNVNIATEKELILILSRSETKTSIMRSIIKLAGPDTEAGAIVFSMPVTDIGGLNLEEQAIKHHVD